MDSPKRTARLAGLAYLLLGLANLLGFLCAPLVQADPAMLARTIMASELRFRVALVSDLMAQVCSIFLALLLYQLLKPVNRRHAALMALLVLVAIPVSFLLALNDVAAQILLSEADSVSAFTKPQIEILASLFLKLHFHGVYAVEIYWGLWLLPFGLLVFRSGFLPRILGVLLAIGGFAYVAHSFVSLFLPGPRPAAYEIATMVGRGVGELPIMFWLLIKGVDVKQAST